jgi:uncharacterized membrane protein YhaH (DUF805 family)
MVSWPSSERIRFLYRADQGRIDRDVWRRGALGLLSFIAPFVGVWLLLAPYTEHDLAKSPLFVPMTALAYAYLIFFAFVVMLVAISFINLSAKRFRAIGRPAPVGLASLLPLAAFLDGVTHGTQVLLAEATPGWLIYPFDAALVAVLAWTVYELGFAPEPGGQK